MILPNVVEIVRYASWGRVLNLDDLGRRKSRFPTALLTLSVIHPIHRFFSTIGFGRTFRSEECNLGGTVF